MFEIASTSGVIYLTENGGEFKRKLSVIVFSLPRVAVDLFFIGIRDDDFIICVTDPLAPSYHLKCGRIHL